MGGYVRNGLSARDVHGDDLKGTVRAVANRFMADNPEHSYSYRVCVESKIGALKDYRYKLDFNEIFPQSENGDVVYAFTKVFSQKSQPFVAAINTSCPLKVYLNGEEAYKSGIHAETNIELKQEFTMQMKEGYNYICLEMKKVNSGFCAHFGNVLDRWEPLSYLVPILQRDGMWGFAYTPPLKNTLSEIPCGDIDEKNFDVKLYPEIKKASFGKGEGYLIAKTVVRAYEGATVDFTAETSVELFMDGKPLAQLTAGETKRIELFSGTLIVRSDNNCEGRGFCVGGVKNAELLSPMNLKGSKDSFVYMGPFVEDIDIKEFLSNDRIIADRYWVSDIAEGEIRIFLEDAVYGRWNYPLGVTLYGFMTAAEEFDMPEVGRYALAHIKEPEKRFKYAFWDEAKYTAAHVNHLLFNMDMLDDCGAFGNALLESIKFDDTPEKREIAEYVANYIYNVQQRTETGAFCRMDAYMDFMRKSLWADDLFMGVPFLAKYYSLTGDSRYADLAAAQYKAFGEYLHKENGIFAHVYSFRYGKNNDIAWGRGNGWTIFSLSELLKELGQDYKGRGELIKFFAQLCDSLLLHQDIGGMWRQIIDDESSYCETSCTAMIASSIARGLRFGWLDATDEKYLSAVRKAWDAVCTGCIDRFGNVYGVCKGSGYSFDSGYYKDELNWLLNDTHGVGIVLLFASEANKLLAEKSILDNESHMN